ncbi:arabinosyltransferase ARAD1 [Pyrus ussuriensis x Pyrus communis]|uniref:Arabinosyltransferase ARAD1 n=1 Tax=Pyrus ussuriensis x Pyrus communis TaxID=2448454 RepID=A0A5N5HRI3_9ROSA|nr:arabinosyltransferase ARAD1 [Pyrus ussuriensis x Pyrus communis]
MYGKAAFALIFAFLLLLTYSIFIGTVDIRSYFFLLIPSSPPPVVRSLCATTSTPLKVYMYNLPHRFNVGIMNHQSTD